MSTLWSAVYKVFFDKIQKDTEFFAYNNIPNQEAFEIALERSKGYLKEAVSQLTLCCSPDINFNDYDDVAEVFNFELTNVEIDLLAELMRERYFDKDLSLLKAFQVRFSPKDLNVFSPAAERNTFTSMLKDIKKDNELSISRYISRDRTTGKLKIINFSQYYND
ncbi:hypothetical protein [Paenibacillus pini]|uniref:Uncharacterized protein n=1 Tax=Paenibacillus pini JCM 16418 TaxID=1236976 RepID=W7Z1H3_9BACL|nr:hypothetical protein [Paenibacillus pini]GAF10841.1 hypothetical protein JCM16418_5066 [Paenibacillus pini JCM 16418]